jgi:hypothetical protein
MFHLTKCNFNTLDPDPDPQPCLEQEAEYVAEAAADVGLDLLQGRQDIGFLLAPEGQIKKQLINYLFVCTVPVQNYRRNTSHL